MQNDPIRRRRLRRIRPKNYLFSHPSKVGGSGGGVQVPPVACRRGWTPSQLKSSPEVDVLLAEMQLWSKMAGLRWGADFRAGLNRRRGSLQTRIRRRRFHVNGIPQVPLGCLRHTEGQLLRCRRGKRGIVPPIILTFCEWAVCFAESGDDLWN